MHPLLPLVAEGFVFGWSVAWPPGPINAEIMRRVIARGPMPAFAVALGASSGDALWALATLLGAGFFLSGTTARTILGLVSTALLFALAGLFLSGAWRALRSPHLPPPARVRFEASHAGYALGLGMALTSPWNLGFWLAVMGRPDLVERGMAASLVVAGSVVAGALAWCCCVIAALSCVRVPLDGRVWEILAKGLTGLLMLAFAIDGAVRLAAG